MNEPRPYDAHDESPAKTLEAISVLIADHQAAFRAGMRASLEADGFVIVAETEDARSTVSAALRTRPDICLMDVVMPGNGLNALAAIARRSPATTTVVLTTSSDSADLIAALERGASGYLLKGMRSAELAKTLRAVRSGEPALSRAMVPALIDQVRGRPRRRLAMPDGSVELTAREWDVAELLRDGLNTAEIAGRLGVSPVTVRRHMTSVLKKLGVPDRQAAIRALNVLGH
jgi:DNA-binding NarL/FixJ family response regulator